MVPLDFIGGLDLVLPYGPSLPRDVRSFSRQFIVTGRPTRRDLEALARRRMEAAWRRRRYMNMRRSAWM